MPSPERSSHRPQSPAQHESDRRHHRSRHGHSHSNSHSHGHRHRDHSRSRSPHRSDRRKSDRLRRHDRDRGERDHRHERRSREPPAQPVILPYQARELSRRDLEAFEPMFAMYLDIQKGLIIEELKDEEVKGRWKSFIRKWNRGELAEGWYDPATLDKARKSAEEYRSIPAERASPHHGRGGLSQDVRAESLPAREDEDGEEAQEDDEEEYGPTLPVPGFSRDVTHSGPTIPNMQDLELKRESAIEDLVAAREDSRQQYRSELRSHKTELRHLEDEITPRAEPGTRERQLEKRREAAAANRAFANARGASPEAAPDAELMGDNDFASLKKEKEKEQRKKNEREIRREEILRARAAEREERVQKFREKEEETIGWLQTLAKQRFG
ncbi:uncharacterized protein N7482_003477 [Penicillium canariense]|uniref:Uncharacterized protein n=1 Tax=Penicillium canariense TaxID=189055 RepID=A0A9W9I6R5_9EURO|nr:uncharacterized protein N7482_003477 [Penicillium canariense]KAJ5167883.1 hypothetical protein N7482_003477 [Penicillium canariense]